MKYIEHIQVLGFHGTASVEHTVKAKNAVHKNVICWVFSLINEENI